MLFQQLSDRKPDRFEFPWELGITQEEFGLFYFRQRNGRAQRSGFRRAAKRSKSWLNGTVSWRCAWSRYRGGQRRLTITFRWL